MGKLPNDFETNRMKSPAPPSPSTSYEGSERRTGDGDKNPLMKNTYTPTKNDLVAKGKLIIEFGSDTTESAALAPPSTSHEGSGRRTGEKSKNPLRKNTSTPTKIDHKAQGKLPIDFGNTEMRGAAPTPAPSSSEGSGGSTGSDRSSETYSTNAFQPSPRPSVTKLSYLRRSESKNLTSKTKDELKAILKSKNLKVGGLRDELIERLEKADRGQSLLIFQLTVPLSPSIKNKRPQPLPTTPQKRRHEAEESSEDENEGSQPSQKESKIEVEGTAEDERGVAVDNSIILHIESEGEKMGEAPGEDGNLTENDLGEKEDDERKEAVPKRVYEKPEGHPQIVIPSSSSSSIPGTDEDIIISRHHHQHPIIIKNTGISNH